MWRSGILLVYVYLLMGKKNRVVGMAEQRIAPDLSAVNAMRRLFAQQVAAATLGNGGVDLGVLSDIVSARY